MTEVTVRLDVPARMRDGVTLRANVYRPSGEGPWPVLLARTPYSKDAIITSEWLDPVKAAASGFIVAIQDTRGRFRSEGEWGPFQFEREDGYDSVEWAATLPGSNGRVGMFGESYVGNTQWMAAVESPPSLAAIAPVVTWMDPMDGLFARGGALELGLAIPWTLETGAGHLARLEISAEDGERHLDSLLDDYDSLAERGYWDLPAHDPAALRHHEPSVVAAFGAWTDPAVAAHCRVQGQHDRVRAAVLNIGGWNDIFLQGTLDNYTAMAALGRPTRLVVGPWAHELLPGRSSGERSFGVRGSTAGVPVHAEGDTNDLQLAWLRRHLAADGDPEAEGEPPVRIFVMGRNEWRDESSWPLERARVQKWFIGTGGTLTPEAPGAGGAVTEFRYDPADPVPTRGGPIVMISAFPAGQLDQAGVEARPDVCVFTSEPLGADLEVTGRVRFVLHAQSSAPSTDWVVRLCDVDPDGQSFNLCDGILRVAEGADRIGRYEVDLWSTSNVFLAGHRLRVHVTSSSFPRWDRNLNTGSQDEKRHAIADQRIYHDSDHASWIELPVVA
jgi:uncharacterized protein